LVAGGESDQRTSRTHRYAQDFPEKCFVFDTGDRVIPFLRGVYASVEKRYWNPKRVKPGFYAKVFDHDSIQPSLAATREKFLFSFVGSFANAPVRRQLAKLSHPRGHIVDTSQAPANLPNQDADTYRAFSEDYARVISNSSFVLCPRGVGTASYRIFEAMKAARVPVIISDQWVPPEELDWESFSLRTRERDVLSIFSRLEELEPHAAALGARARAAWEQYYAEQTAFQTIVDSCLKLKGETTWARERISRCLVRCQMLRPWYLRHLVAPGAARRLRLGRYKREQTL